MTCKPLVPFTLLYRDRGNPKHFFSVTAYLDDPSPWRQALYRLEMTLSKILTVRGRRSWPLNSFLHRHASYWRLRRFLSYGFGEGVFET